MEKFCPKCFKDFAQTEQRCPHDGSFLVSPQEKDLVGDTIDNRYKVQEKIGRGGMGEVYRAEHNLIGRVVALKVLRREVFQDEVAIRRFLTEARVLASLDSPHTVTLHDFGITSNGLLFYTMELLSGRPLSEILAAEGPIAFARAARLVLQACSSLQQAHSRGILHRDLKPDNIFVIERLGKEYVKVLDFGIAKIVGDLSAESVTRTGMIIGTPRYASPEQALGNPVVPASDVYSLAVVFFEMLGGAPPFSEDTPLKTLWAHVQTPCPRLSQVNPRVKVPPRVEELLAKGLAKDSSKRFQTVDEFAQALRTALSELKQDEPVQALPLPVSTATEFPGPRIASAPARGAPPLPSVPEAAEGPAAVATTAQAWPTPPGDGGGQPAEPVAEARPPDPEPLTDDDWTRRGMTRTRISTAIVLPLRWIWLRRRSVSVISTVSFLACIALLAVVWAWLMHEGQPSVGAGKTQPSQPESAAASPENARLDRRPAPDMLAVAGEYAVQGARGKIQSAEGSQVAGSQADPSTVPPSPGGERPLSGDVAGGAADHSPSAGPDPSARLEPTAVSGAGAYPRPEDAGDGKRAAKPVGPPVAGKGEKEAPPSADGEPPRLPKEDSAEPRKSPGGQGEKPGKAKQKTPPDPAQDTASKDVPKPKKGEGEAGKTDALKKPDDGGKTGGKQGRGDSDKPQEKKAASGRKGSGGAGDGAAKPAGSNEENEFSAMAIKLPAAKAPAEPEEERCLSSRGKPLTDALASYEQGKKYLNSGKYEKALSCFRAVKAMGNKTNGLEKLIKQCEEEIARKKDDRDK